MNVYMPAVPAAGVPEIVAVPSPLSVNVTPDGSAPFSDNWQGGHPVDVTVKVPAWPTVKVAWSAPVILHAAWGTVRVKFWVAAGPTPFVAVIVNVYVPAVPAAGVPDNVAVPLLLSLNVTPDGSAPVSDNVHVGTPVDVTVKVPAWLTVKVAPAGLVILHAWLTVRVKFWVAVREDDVRGGDREAGMFRRRPEPVFPKVSPYRCCCP